MSAQLGVGVRVWVGWTASDELIHVSCDPRMRTGTIADGPFDPGDIVTCNESGQVVRLRTKERMWNVKLDSGEEVAAVESVIFPIDDGDPAAQRERADRGEEVEA